MFKILGKIFNPKKLGDSITSGIDKLILTNEEKIDYMKEMLKLYEPYKLAQRILAIMFSGVFLLIHLITAITHFIYTVKEIDTKSIIELYNYNNETLGTLVLMVTSFYFAGGLLEGTVNKLNKHKL
jgi:hypothetical protein